MSGVNLLAKTSDRRTDGRTDGRADGRTDGRTDRRTDRRTDANRCSGKQSDLLTDKGEKLEGRIWEKEQLPPTMLTWDVISLRERGGVGSGF